MTGAPRQTQNVLISITTAVVHALDGSCSSPSAPWVRGGRSSTLVVPRRFDRDRFGELCGVMDGTLRSRRLPTVVLLLLCAASPCLEAQQFVCSPIGRADTASRLARRLIGNPAAAYSHAFQIWDPARQMFVPKSHYWRLSTQWQACVATRPVRVRRTPLAYAPAVALAAPVVAPVAPVVAPPGPAITTAPLATKVARPVPALSDRSHVDFVFIATSASAVLLLLVVYAAVDPLVSRRIPPVMQGAGERFVIAFARPLIDPSSRVPPIQARLRYIRRAQRLEISIAPGAGRRYPNLADHKRNVEYDVNRVMRLLGNHFVVSDRLRAAGKWVVVPIRLADVKQTGAK